MKESQNRNFHWNPVLSAAVRILEALICHASKGQEDDIGARDSDDYEEHKTRLAKGGDGEASKQLLSENESIGI